MSTSKPRSFKGSIEGYVVNQLEGTYWRVESSMSRLDVLQEAFLVFDRVRLRYPSVEDKHFMALFKRSWSNRFTDLAYVDSRRRDMEGTSLTTDEDAPERHDIGDTDNAGYLTLLVGQMPGEIRTVVNLLLNAPGEMVDVLLDGFQSKDRRARAAANRRCAQWLGYPVDSAPLDMVRDYLTN